MLEAMKVYLSITCTIYQQLEAFHSILLQAQKVTNKEHVWAKDNKISCSHRILVAKCAISIKAELRICQIFFKTTTAKLQHTNLKL